MVIPLSPLKADCNHDKTNISAVIIFLIVLMGTIQSAPMCLKYDQHDIRSRNNTIHLVFQIDKDLTEINISVIYSLNCSFI